MLDQIMGACYLIERNHLGDVQPRAVIGTVAYMSPEQSAGYEIDARSDVFSLGAVLYELTSGQSPFPGKDVIDVLQAIQHRQPTPLEQQAPTCRLLSPRSRS